MEGSSLHYKRMEILLQTLAYPIGWSDTAYWLSGTIGSGFQVVFNESGSIYLTTRNGSILTVISSNPSSTQDFYQRAIMEYDGVFTQYVYPKNSTNGSNAGRWPMAWSSLVYIPPNIQGRTHVKGKGGWAPLEPKKIIF